MCGNICETWQECVATQTAKRSPPSAYAPFLSTFIGPQEIAAAKKRDECIQRDYPFLTLGERAELIACYFGTFVSMRYADSNGGGRYPALLASFKRKYKTEVHYPYDAPK